MAVEAVVRSTLRVGVVLGRRNAFYCVESKALVALFRMNFLSDVVCEPGTTVAEVLLSASKLDKFEPLFDYLSIIIDLLCYFSAVTF